MLVKCPQCSKRTAWEENPFRPFCSERCRLIDLGKWASSKILVALGDCAVFGGVPAMRNFCGVEAALQRAYVEAESKEPGSQIPNDPELATMQPTRAIQEVVPVDYNVPGCPPDADTFFYVLAELAQGRKPELKDELLHWH